ncbi:hypothetical protein SFRURICE_008020 [Spodoptera frugiperda]|nr:hypothetical protein SFRURICE_008020 [Spodoptera frugiperda]
MPGADLELKFARLTENAFPPTKGSEKAAGYDLKSAYNYVVPARGKELVKTDLQIELPSGCYGRVAPRSGLAVKNFIDVGDIFFESAVISLRYLLISSETAELQSLFFSLTICSTLVSSSSLVNMLSTTS